MPYKDKNKQKEAQRDRTRRYRAKQKGVTDDGVTRIVGVTPRKGMTETEYALKQGADVKSLPANFGQPDCQCRHCQANRANGSKHAINHGSYKPAHLLANNELNRASLPGDTDYVGVASLYRQQVANLPVGEYVAGSTPSTIWRQ